MEMASMSDREERPQAKSPADERLIIRTGTYLHPCCPNCGYDLVGHDQVLLIVIGPGGQRGELRLSPRFNVFQKESSIGLADGTQLQDLLCPRCGGSMVESERPCELCNSRAAKLRISVVGRDLDLFICTRVGCPWHGLAKEDGQSVILDKPPQTDL
jgi:hypothetical protein